MHVNVIDSNSLDSFNYLLFPEQNPNNQYFIQQQLSQFNNGLTDLGRKFMESSKEIYNKINDATAIRIAKAAIRNAVGMFHPNTILYLSDIEDIRAAKPMMQRYIMAQPDLRNIYHKQRCDGYSDSYIDVQPNVIGEKHYDFRRVMDGVIQDSTNKETGEYEWVSHNYYDSLHEGDRDLTFTEQVDIMKTWDIINMFVKQGKDPTSLFGDKIG